MEWFNSLPLGVREGIEFASEITMRQNHAKVPAARAYSMAEMKKAGVSFYEPDANQKADWIDKSGVHLPAWDNMKKELTGSLSLFEELQEAADAPSGYFVHDV